MARGDLTQLDTVKQWLGLTGLGVAAISNSSPAILTLAASSASPTRAPLLSGVAYTIEGATGIVLPDGEYIITVIDPLNFSIPYDTTMNGTYTGGAIVGITDPLVSRLISACSVYIQNYLNRTIASADYVESRDGTGTGSLMLDNYPVLNVSSLTVNGFPITRRPPLGVAQSGSYTFNGSPGGFVFNNVSIMISGGCFWRGWQNVVIAYSAGFQVNNEAQTVPADPGPYVLTTLAHWSAGDRGVTYANGTALQVVTTPTAAGQYAVDGSTYTFSAADAGAAVLLTYAYVPQDIEQATIDMIGDWFRYRDRIGKLSEGIEGQTISFTNTGIPARAQAVLQQYRKVAPIAP